MTFIPAGSFFIPPDINGNPGTILSSTDGAILDTFAFPPSEEGATLPDGAVLVQDDQTLGLLKLYDGDLVFVTDLNPWGSVVTLICANLNDLFYVTTRSGGGAAVVYTVDALGNVGGSTWTLPADSANVRLTAVARDDSILYYAHAITDEQAIHRYDLVNDVPLSDLVPSVAGEKLEVGNLLVLLDGTILATYLLTGGLNIIRHLSAAGALLHTYASPIPGTTQMDHLVLAYPDTASEFWVRWFTDVTFDVSQFQRLRVSDGAALSDYTIANSETDGPSPTCPLLLLQQSIGTPDLVIEKTHTGSFTRGGSGTFTVTVSNPISGSATSGIVTVTETIPTGFVLGAMSGTGWDCTDNVCTRDDVLDPGDSYPPILVTVLVDADAPDTVCNDVEVDTESGDPVETTDCVAIVDMVTVTYPARRLRRFALPFDQNKWIFIHRLEFIMQTGVGLISGQGSDPVVMMRLSRDGGETWGPEREMSIGKMGAYKWRVFTNRLGRARNPVVELTVSDPVLLAFMSCTADLESGVS